ncbi:hypothetical protein, partial [Ralstonia sp. TCR112]|uniref:hypothetical protein n=1 Tax=Ralstonia sp. TCR112 TaxID=2601730 RepID=UPI0021C2B202
CVGKSSASGSVSQGKLNSDYAAVGEQSGIRTGDGGFQIDVKGNTDFKGGVIASSDRAVQDGVNTAAISTSPPRARPTPPVAQWPARAT